MSEEFFKEERIRIVQELVEGLREYSDGAETTTTRLLGTCGYGKDEFNQEEKALIHTDLLKAAKNNHITLVMSGHERNADALSYDLGYVIHNKEAQIKCPFCGSKKTARIKYGYPVFTEILERKLDEGKVILGGCCIREVFVGEEWVQSDPSRICNECGKKFGRRPLLIAKDEESAEDYRDIVKSIKFSVGGFFNGSTEVLITRNEKGALVKVQRFPFGENAPEDVQITAGRWSRILDKLYTQMYLHEWKKRYVDPHILDGTQWELTISLKGKRVRNYYGSNDFPPYWKELTGIFRSFAKL